MGSSASAAHGFFAHRVFNTGGADNGKSRSRSLNLSQLRRERWLRRRSHLSQARLAWYATLLTLEELPRTAK